MSIELSKGKGRADIRTFVCPTRELRAVLYRHRDKLVPGCNYVVDWKDAHGWGLTLAVAEWAGTGTYHCPPSAFAPYYNPPRFTADEIRKAIAVAGRHYRDVLTDWEHQAFEGPYGRNV